MEPIKEKTNTEKLLEAITLGVDASPADKATDEFGCAESVSNILKRVFPDFPILVSTYDLFVYLKNSPHFKATLTPKKGCVIVSPRTATVNGHTGIFLSDTEIASNDSSTGKFEKNFTFQKWITYYRDKKGLRIFLFELL